MPGIGVEERRRALRHLAVQAPVATGPLPMQSPPAVAKAPFLARPCDIPASASGAAAPTSILAWNFPAAWLLEENLDKLQKRVMSLLLKFGTLVLAPELFDRQADSVKVVRATYAQRSHAERAINTLHGMDNRSNKNKSMNNETLPLGSSFFVAQFCMQQPGETEGNRKPAADHSLARGKAADGREEGEEARQKESAGLNNATNPREARQKASAVRAAPRINIKGRPKARAGREPTPLKEQGEEMQSGQKRKCEHDDSALDDRRERKRAKFEVAPSAPREGPATRAPRDVASWNDWKEKFGAEDSDSSEDAEKNSDGKEAVDACPKTPPGSATPVERAAPESAVKTALGTPTTVEGAVPKTTTKLTRPKVSLIRMLLEKPPPDVSLRTQAAPESALPSADSSRPSSLPPSPHLKSAVPSAESSRPRPPLLPPPAHLQAAVPSAEASRPRPPSLPPPPHLLALQKHLLPGPPPTAKIPPPPRQVSFEIAGFHFSKELQDPPAGVQTCCPHSSAREKDKTASRDHISAESRILSQTPRRSRSRSPCVLRSARGDKANSETEASSHLAVPRVILSREDMPARVIPAHVSPFGAVIPARFRQASERAAPLRSEAALEQQVLPCGLVSKAASVAGPPPPKSSSECAPAVVLPTSIHKGSIDGALGGSSLVGGRNSDNKHQATRVEGCPGALPCAPVASEIKDGRHPRPALAAPRPIPSQPPQPAGAFLLSTQTLSTASLEAARVEEASTKAEAASSLAVTFAPGEIGACVEWCSRRVLRIDEGGQAHHQDVKVAQRERDQEVLTERRRQKCVEKAGHGLAVHQALAAPAPLPPPPPPPPPPLVPRPPSKPPTQQERENAIKNPLEDDESADLSVSRPRPPSRPPTQQERESATRSLHIRSPHEHDERADLNRGEKWREDDDWQDEKAQDDQSQGEWQEEACTDPCDERKGETNSNIEVKDEDGSAIVHLGKIRFTHDNIRSTFHDRKPLATLTEDLISGKVHPLEHPNLILDCVKAVQSDTYHSLFNRRLHCLKEYQKSIDKVVHARVNVVGTFNDRKTMLKFIESHTSRNHGAAVRLRQNRQAMPNRDERGSARRAHPKRDGDVPAFRPTSPILPVARGRRCVEPAWKTRPRLNDSSHMNEAPSTSPVPTLVKQVEDFLSSYRFDEISEKTLLEQPPGVQAKVLACGPHFRLAGPADFPHLSEDLLICIEEKRLEWHRQGNLLQEVDGSSSGIVKASCTASRSTERSSSPPVSHRCGSRHSKRTALKRSAKLKGRKGRGKSVPPWRAAETPADVTKEVTRKRGSRGGRPAKGLHGAPRERPQKSQRR